MVVSFVSVYHDQARRSSEKKSDGMSHRVLVLMIQYSESPPSKTLCYMLSSFNLYALCIDQSISMIA